MQYTLIILNFDQYIIRTNKMLYWLLNCSKSFCMIISFNISFIDFIRSQFKSLSYPSNGLLSLYCFTLIDRTYILKCFICRQCLCCFKDYKNFERFNNVVQVIMNHAIKLIYSLPEEEEQRKKVEKMETKSTDSFNDLVSFSWKKIMM